MADFPGWNRLVMWKGNHMIPTLTCQLAENKHAREQVYRLRYACYLRKGSITPHPEEQFRDEFDEEPNSFSFLVRDQSGEAQASVRISVVNPIYGWLDSPAGHVFGDHETFQSIAQESYVEASRLCFRQQARRDSFISLVGNMAALAEFYQARWMVACPREEHTHIYQRLFGFRELAPARQYFGVSFRTCLLGIRTTDLRGFVQKDKTMTAAWSDALQYLRNSLRSVSPLTASTPAFRTATVAHH